ncbi:MAG: electron transport complex subunit RsxB, partial [Gammaproteobacteria bacterium]
MIIALITIAIITLGLGSLLGWAAVRFKVEGDPVADQVESLLPQTQCGQCEFAGCRPYAEAVAKGEAAINRCAPGGESTMLAIAEMLEVEPEEVDPEHDKSSTELVALIDEETCIGCTKCIQACPVDAIIGAAKLMHTVIKEDCTGCELCLPPCPVDCIDMVPVFK